MKKDKEPEAMLVIPDAVQASIELIVESYKNRNALAKAGSECLRSAAIYGATGTGKTKLAAYLAGRLGLTLLRVPLTGYNDIPQLYEVVTTSKETMALKDTPKARDLAKKGLFVLVDDLNDEAAARYLLYLMEDPSWRAFLAVTTSDGSVMNMLDRSERFSKMIRLPNCLGDNGNLLLIEGLLKRVEHRVDIHAIVELMYGYSVARVTRIVNEAIMLARLRKAPVGNEHFFEVVGRK